MKKTLGIVGFGQFGKFLYEQIVCFFGDKYDLKIYSIDFEPDFVKFFPRREVVACDVVILSLPISSFESEVDYLVDKVKDNSTIIDVCSVKMFPKKIMQAKLSKIDNKKVNLVATHPMFGPNSYEKNGNKLDNLNLVVENIGCDALVYKNILQELNSLKLNVVEMSADEHDRQSAEFHFLTLFMAGVLKNLKFERSKIETYSFKMLMNFLEGVGADNQIVKDMYRYNPYCENYLKGVKDSFDSMFAEIKKD